MRDSRLIEQETQTLNYFKHRRSRETFKGTGVKLRFKRIRNIFLQTEV
jgi:hypothetical protein